MRLIDADKIVNSLGSSDVDLYTSGLIDEQPTAFDVDEVIEQMEQRRANFDCKSCRYGNVECEVCDKDCSDALIDDLLDIVKGGGVE